MDEETAASLGRRYAGYIDCLNRQAWAELGAFVADDVRHNERPFGLSGYRAMLECDFVTIPDLCFVIDWQVCEPPSVAARLRFRCHPLGLFLDLPVNGRLVEFHEHVFYRWANGKIVSVWSILDKAAIERQLP